MEDVYKRQVYGVMLNGTFMTSIRFSWAMRDLVTLLCIGIALAPAFKMRFWNIGAEGQVLMGGLATAMVMVKCGASLPTPVLFLVMFLTSVIAGGLWGFIPVSYTHHRNAVPRKRSDGRRSQTGKAEECFLRWIKKMAR